MIIYAIIAICLPLEAMQFLNTLVINDIVLQCYRCHQKMTKNTKFTSKPKWTTIKMTENNTRVLRKGKQFIAINIADTICGYGLL